MTFSHKNLLNIDVTELALSAYHEATISKEKGKVGLTRQSMIRGNPGDTAVFFRIATGSTFFKQKFKDYAPGYRVYKFQVFVFHLVRGRGPHTQIY